MPTHRAELVQALHQITRAVCDIPSDVWVSATEANDPLWQALNEIDRIAFMAAVEANDRQLFKAIRRTDGLVSDAS